MKKRLLSILLTLCMLLSLLPTAVFAAENYELYINEFQFTSSKLSYSGSEGTASYDPKTKTLTLKDFETRMGEYNTVVYSEIDGLNIVIDGRVTIHLTDAGTYEQGAVAFLLKGSTVIRGQHNDKSKDQLLLDSCCTTHTGSGTTHTGIATAAGATLTMSNVAFGMSDSSVGDREGHATLIDAGGNAEFNGCALTTLGGQYGLYMEDNAGATVRNTSFNINLTGSSSSGVNLSAGTQNLLENCTGTIEADYPLYSYGSTTVTGSGKLTLKTEKMAVVAAKDNENSAAGSVTFRDANVEIDSGSVGLQAQQGGTLSVQGGTVAVTDAKQGVVLLSGGKLELQSGSMTLTSLRKTEGSVGISMNGPVNVTGGKLTISGMESGIQNTGTYTASFSGGTHTVTDVTVGYIDNAAGALTVSGDADVTFTASTAVQFAKGSLNLTGGKLTLNGSDSCLNILSGAGKTTLSGGTLDVNGKVGSGAKGIYAEGQVEFSGTNVNFTGCKTDLVSLNAGIKLTAGKLSLSGSGYGMNVGAAFTMEGGEIVSSGCSRGIVANGAAVILKNGQVSITASYPFWAANGGSFEFAGAEVLGNSTANCAMYVDTKTEGNSYKVTGGTVELQSTQYAANIMYTSIPSGYGVWAGEDKDSAKRIPSPTLENSLGGSKYARIARAEAYTLTLVNVKEGDSASHLGGAAITYTAKDAPAGQHFSHWELTVDGETTNVGTDTTYTGTMPYGNARLEAVYEACSGGQATCTERAVCSTCGRAYGDLADHTYTAETVNEKYLKAEATCTEAAVYYKSCAACGESSEGTAQEATFTSGTSLGHDFGDWTSNGDGTHTRICSRDSSHTETENCSGGTADCQHKAVCTLCGGEYGEAGQHNYTAETVGEKYLKAEATCTEAAVYYKSCTGCGESSEGTAAEATFTSGDPLGHDFGTWTSNGDGTHTRICSRDSSHTETENCSGGQADCQHKAVCALCGSEYGELGRHDYSAEVVDEKYLLRKADCTSEAAYYMSCSVCGESSKGTLGEAVFFAGKPLGHDEVTDPAKAAACTETGLTEGVHCARCGLVLTAQDEVPALGHDVPTGTVRKEATCAEEGEMVGTCQRCGKKNVVGAIAKLPHQEIIVPAVAATCSTSGWTEGKKCTVCGQYTEGRQVIQPLGHTVVIDPETDDLTEGKHCSVCGAVLQGQMKKGGGYWLDAGNYDAELYASEPGNWVIYDAADLAALSKKVSDGATFEGYTISLAADIDLSEHVWVPIGQRLDRNPGLVDRPFKGTFLGNLHRITGMRIVSMGYYGSQYEVKRVGLFGEISNAAVSDLIVEGDIYNTSIKGTTVVGGIVGSMDNSTLRNCGFVGSIYQCLRDPYKSYQQFAGGVVGRVEGTNSTIANCFAIGDITVEQTKGAPLAGGIAASAIAWSGDTITIENCYSAVLVTTRGNEGWNGADGIVTEKLAVGEVTIHGCSTQVGFNTSAEATSSHGANLTKEAMTAAAGTKLDSQESPLVDALNAEVREHWTQMQLRSWIQDPNGNGGYPTFGVSAAASLSDGTWSVQALAVGETAEASAFTIPAGYLVEWYADEAYTTPFDFSQPIYDNTVVYGKLIPNTFPIVYVLSGGENSTANPSEYLGGVGVAAFAAPTRENYIFGGWFTDEGFTQPIDSIPQDATGNYTLFAKWTLDPDHSHQLSSCVVGADGLHDRVCRLCGEAFDCHYTDVVTEPTCDRAGYTTHSCDGCGNSFVDTIIEGGHKWTADVHAPTHTEMGYTRYTCSVCQETYTSDYKEPLGHSFDKGTVTKKATCTEDGEMTYACSCGATHTAPIPRTGHSFTDVVTKPTCNSAGYTTHTCGACGYSYVDTIIDGGHKWTADVHAPTHTEMGYTRYTCTVCQETYTSDYIEPLGHSFDEGTVTKKATCTEDGEMTYACSCGATHTAPIPKTGHKWDGGKVTTAPTVTKTGLFVQTCTACGATKEELIPMLSSCDGGSGCPSKAYTDVPGASHWSHVGIDFVLKSGLFYGTSDTTFDPKGEMTRAMLVTVLYRLEGQPKPTAANPFADVPNGKWYTDAVTWAAENGIVSGIGEGKFDPNGTVTREQMAAILYRYTKFKGLTVEGGSFVETYPDESRISAYARPAMAWANANGLISGTKDGDTVYLDPKGSATRAQVASILMRYVKNILSK